MDQENNRNSIRALEKQIEEHEKALIQLKRTRNSLLNVSILLPPEILGKIFHCNVVPDGDFGGPSQGSYNFLLVCHHWFEVASRTPELWCSWGDSIQDWAHRCAHHGTVPLDLALGWYTQPDSLGDELRDALRDRAARDTIRRVHLNNPNAKLLNFIVSSITTKGEGTQLSSVESFILQNGDYSMVLVDVSDFFARYRFPKLKHLRLSGCGISSWDSLRSKAMALTSLNLATSGRSTIPTGSQLISVLSSNPLLQNLSLAHGSVPRVVDVDRSSPRVPLRHLKVLHLASGFCHVFGLLNRLEIPEKTVHLWLFLSECSPLDISQTLGPYIGDHIRRRSRCPGGELGLFAQRRSGVFHLCAEDVHERGDPAIVARFMTVEVAMNRVLEERAEETGFDLIAHIPRKEFASLRTTLPILHSEELCVKMCNLVELHLGDVDMSTFVVESDIREPHTPKDLLPRLASILITRPVLSGGGWGPFMDFLARRAAVGNRISSLKIGGFSHIDTDVVEKMSRMVGVFGDVDTLGWLQYLPLDLGGG